MRIVELVENEMVENDVVEKDVVEHVDGDGVGVEQGDEGGEDVVVELEEVGHG